MNISFTKSSENDSHILWASLNNEDSDGSLGYAYFPSGGNYDGLATINYEEYTTSAGEIEDEDILWIDKGADDKWAVVKNARDYTLQQTVENQNGDDSALHNFASSIAA